MSDRLIGEKWLKINSNKVAVKVEEKLNQSMSILYFQTSQESEENVEKYIKLTATE